MHAPRRLRQRGSPFPLRQRGSGVLHCPWPSRAPRLRGSEPLITRRQHRPCRHPPHAAPRPSPAPRPRCGLRWPARPHRRGPNTLIRQPAAARAERLLRGSIATMGLASAGIPAAGLFGRLLQAAMGSSGIHPFRGCWGSWDQFGFRNRSPRAHSGSVGSRENTNDNRLDKG